MRTIGIILAAIITAVLLTLWFLCFMDTKFEDLAELLFAPFAGWCIGRSGAKFYKWYESKLR